MPLGFERLNARKSQPNPSIVFIKPLKGPDEAVAQDFLERIAAQCVPIMKSHTISVVSLEEYEPNREFVGRNFNAGEVVQLVLKSHSGRWLPFEYVQMVMMHELAHCKQMNHSKAFWAVRNQYAEQMRVLWANNYTGEGLWGRGALLGTGEWEKNTVLSDEALPEHLCGGTYQSRRRKRKAKNVLSYQEQKQRRILKKFGANGVALGDDETSKKQLEGKRVPAKPRVAGSKRGRDLRAAAALARFEQQKEEQVQDDDETASEAEESDDDDYAGTEAGIDAVDIDGKKLRDRKGHRMVKVCEDENPDDQEARNELEELQSSMRKQEASRKTSSSNGRDKIKPPGRPVEPITAFSAAEKAKKSAHMASAAVKEETHPAPRLTLGPSKSKPDLKSNETRVAAVSCPICSFSNTELSVTCGMCAHVLDPEGAPNSWHCKSSVCKGSLFVNSGDCGVCGVCGERKLEPLES